MGKKSSLPLANRDRVVYPRILTLGNSTCGAKMIGKDDFDDDHGVLKFLTVSCLADLT